MNTFYRKPAPKPLLDLPRPSPRPPRFRPSTFIRKHLVKIATAAAVAPFVFIAYGLIANAYGDQEAAARAGAQIWAEQMGIVPRIVNCLDNSVTGHDVDCTIADDKQRLYTVTCNVTWGVCRGCMLSSARRDRGSTTVVPIIIPTGH